MKNPDQNIYLKKTTNVKLVIEFSEFGCLNHILHESQYMRYNMKHVLRWMIALCKGLDHMHSLKPHPVTHRDLKPLNLLLFDGGLTLKVSDFGTSKKIQMRMTNSIGSIAYMAPEVIKCNTYDQMCDVYSVGVIFWECLARKIPYFWLDNNPTIIAYKIANEGLRPLKINSKLPQISSIYKCCIRDEPSSRPSAKVLIQKFTEIDKIEKTQAFPLDYTEPTLEKDKQFLNTLFGENNSGFVEEALEIIVSCIYFVYNNIFDLYYSGN